MRKLVAAITLCGLVAGPFVLPVLSPLHVTGETTADGIGVQPYVVQQPPVADGIGVQPYASTALLADGIGVQPYVVVLPRA